MNERIKGESEKGNERNREGGRNERTKGWTVKTSSNLSCNALQRTEAKEPYMPKTNRIKKLDG